jgi:hypothetical protein
VALGRSWRRTSQAGDLGIEMKDPDKAEAEALGLDARRSV